MANYGPFYIDGVNEDDYSSSELYGPFLHPLGNLESGVLSTVFVGARFGAVAGLRADAFVTVLVEARFGAVAGLRAAAQATINPEVRLGATAGLRAELVVLDSWQDRLRERLNRLYYHEFTPPFPVVNVGARFGAVAGLRISFFTAARVEVRFGAWAGLRDGYVGPGTGVVVEGAELTLFDLLAGDECNVLLPWVDEQGRAGKLRVLSRTDRDEAIPQFVLQLIEADDPAAIPALAGGQASGYRAPDQADTIRELGKQREAQRSRRRRT